MTSRLRFTSLAHWDGYHWLLEVRLRYQVLRTVVPATDKQSLPLLTGTMCTWRWVKTNMIWCWLEIVINSIVVYDFRPRSESSSHCPTPIVAKPGQARQAYLRIFFPQRWFVCQSIGSRYIGHYHWVSVFLSGLRFGVVRLDDDDAYIGLAWKIRFPGIARYWTGDSILLQGKESSRRPMGILLNNFKLGLAVHPILFLVSHSSTANLRRHLVHSWQNLAPYGQSIMLRHKPKKQDHWLWGIYRGKKLELSSSF